MSGLVTVGWREWVALPDLGLPAVHCKIDTGAATSALHALEIHVETRDRASWARFLVPQGPEGEPSTPVECLARVVDERIVKSSSGHHQTRVVVSTELRLGPTPSAPGWPIEVTLADRRHMRFPMLLGREAMRGRILVDASLGYVVGTPPSGVPVYESPGHR